MFAFVVVLCGIYVHRRPTQGLCDEYDVSGLGLLCFSFIVPRIGFSGFRSVAPLNSMSGLSLVSSVIALNFDDFVALETVLKMMRFLVSTEILSS